MPDKKQERRKRARTMAAETALQHSHAKLPLKEFNYVLQIGSQDLEIIEKHQALLSQGATGFAEVYYNYLFDNPAIADVLYSFERSGGNIGELVRAELKYMLGALSPPLDLEASGERLENSGSQHLEKGVKPIWIVGAYRLFLDYLQKLVRAADIPSHDGQHLLSTLNKIVLRDLGVLLETFREASLDSVRRELVHVEKQQGRAEDLLAGLPHLFWSVDIRNNTILYANYTLHELYAQTLEAPLPCLADTCEEDRQQLLTAWQEAVSGNMSHTEVRMSLADGPQHWYRLSIYPSLNRRGRTVQVHCMLEDIDAVVSERRQLEELATTDKLTRLPNRAMWNDHLNMALAASRRVPGLQIAVISLDINQFKMYNDTLGCETGDMLLREMANRLNSVVRESDSLARLGGDQFGILLQPVDDARSAAERVITQVLDCFDLPFACGNKQVCISVTLGASCFPGHGADEKTLLASAESAMYRAKRNGLAYQFFDPDSDVSPVEKLQYSGQIRGALDNNEFELHYQPQVDINSSRITGAEALLRWQHPVDGTVPPQRIIPVAEQLGMISPLTDWVLITALRQCKEWSYSGKKMPVSVNVSARTFQSPRLFEKIEHALQEAGIDGDCLEIEITEASLMHDLEHATRLLARLSDAGIKIAIDDFGTGYSSLSHLKRLPINTLKIDQSFIMDAAFDTQDVAIVRSIIDLGHNLGYKVIAEGVENRTAWRMLNDLGCDAAQGFHISRPLPDDNFSSWLTDSSWSC